MGLSLGLSLSLLPGRGSDETMREGLRNDHRLENKGTWAQGKLLT